MKKKQLNIMELILRLFIDGLLKDSKKILVSYYIFIIFIIGGGRKVREPEMDKKLLKWFYSFHVVQGNKITPKDFKKKALEFSNDSTFKASEGWLQKFRKRYNIKLN